MTTTMFRHHPGAGPDPADHAAQPSRTRRVDVVARLAVGVALLAVLSVRFGAEPFLAGVRAVSWQAVVVAILAGAVSTLCCAVRWQAVSRTLGLELHLPGAIAANYRAQLVNTLLPFGVVGDFQRAMRQGRDAGQVRQGVRAVVTERVAGQVVQTTVCVGILAIAPSPLRGAALVAFGVLAVLVLALPVATRVRAFVRPLRPSYSPIVVTSVVVLAVHTATLLVVLHHLVPHVPLDRAVPLALVLLLAMSVPLGVGGWGPREGAAAWAFGAAGLGSATGVSVGVTYGVLVLLAAAPGALVLAADLAPRGVRRHG